MKYFAALLPMISPEKSEKYRQEHIDYVEEMREKKRIFQFGRFMGGAGGLVIYQGKNIDEVTDWVKQDPYVIKGARGFEVHEWEMKTDYQISE